MPTKFQHIYLSVFKGRRISVDYIGDNIYALYLFPAQGKPDYLLGPAYMDAEALQLRYTRFLDAVWHERRMKAAQAGERFV